VRKTSALLLGLFIFSGCGSTCNKPKGVLEACEAYGRMRACEANLLQRPAVHINCKSLQSKFEAICSQQEIDYAARIFANDEKRLCALKSVGELKEFKSSFEVDKVSPYCYQAATDCGPECFDTGIDDIP
jgi:hypothetical protein